MEVLAKRYKFKLAKLLMDKGVPSELDTSITGYSQDYEDLEYRMIELVCDLQRLGYTVRRYKIENTLLDSRPQNDPLRIIQ